MVTGLVVAALSFVSSCKESVSTPNLAEQIRATGLVLDALVKPISLFKLMPGESKPLLLDSDPKRYIGFFVQGIGEHLVAIHKANGKYPAILLNSAAESEAVQTSYGGATHFKTTNSDGKLTLTVESRHPNPIFVVIYTTSAS